MFEKAIKIINSIPIEECIDLYCYWNENCTCAEENDYRNHIIAKLKTTCRFHRMKGKISEINTFKFYNIVAWIDYCKEKYKIV